MLLSRRPARRHLALAGVSLFAFGAMTSAASANWGGSSYDRVIGLGTNNPPLTQIAGFILDAGSGPNGESPFGGGAFALQQPAPIKLTYNAGLISCLRVSGNTATMVYTIKWQKKLPTDISTVDSVRVYVQDNGYPSQWWKPVDRVRNTLFDSTKFPEFLNCPDPADPKTTEFINKADPITSGDTVVKDAS